MQFTNKTSDALRTQWGLIEPDAPVVVTVDEAAGLVLQCGEDGNWAPADDDAQAAVEKALAAVAAESDRSARALQSLAEHIGGEFGDVLASAASTPAPKPLPKPPAVKPDPKPAPTPDAAPTPAEAVPAEEK